MTLATPAFAKTSNPEVDAERRRAFRALLRNPLLTATGETAAEYQLVRRHFEWLKRWFAKFPAWSLHIDREVVRLRKVPANHLDETRPAIDRKSGTAFTRRRYALLCLALAALEKMDRQTTLGQVAQTVMELIAADRDLQAAGLVFEIGNHDQRRDLIHAIRLLLDTGVLRSIDGDEQQFLNRSDHTAESDVLYSINRHILAAMLQVSRSASTVETTSQGSRGHSLRERVLKLAAHPIPVTEDGRNQWIRSRMVRTLLDDPILYVHDLDHEERIYLEKQRSYLLRQISEASGLKAEVRGEGIAMVDDVGDLTDLMLPEEGSPDTEGHLTLLLAQWFAEYSRNAPRAAIPVSAVEDHIRNLFQVHGSEWQKELREPGAETRLSKEAMLRLRALRLIQITADGVVPLAAAGRYAATTLKIHEE